MSFLLFFKSIDIPEKTLALADFASALISFASAQIRIDSSEEYQNFCSHLVAK